MHVRLHVRIYTWVYVTSSSSSSSSSSISRPPLSSPSPSSSSSSSSAAFLVRPLFASCALDATCSGKLTPHPHTQVMAQLANGGMQNQHKHRRQTHIHPTAANYYERRLLGTHLIGLLSLRHETGPIGLLLCFVLRVSLSIEHNKSFPYTTPGNAQTRKPRSHLLPLAHHLTVPLESIVSITPPSTGHAPHLCIEKKSKSCSKASSPPRPPRPLSLPFSSSQTRHLRLLGYRSCPCA